MSKEYRIYVLNSENRIYLAHDFVGHDDAEALNEAEQFAESNAVELWQGCRLVKYLARMAN